MNSNSTLPPGDSEIIDPSTTKYGWLLVIDLLIFVGLTFVTYTSSQKIKADDNNPDDFRPKFIKGLVVANGIRTLSLIFIIMLGNPCGDNGVSWLNSLLHVLPAFIFVSAYMYLATFLAELYYQNIEYNNHIMKPALMITVGSGYIILALIALITFCSKSYKAFGNISEFLMALLYLVLGSVIIYYGNKVSLFFQLKSQNKFDAANELRSRISILSYSLGGLFLLKGLSGLLTGLTLLNSTTIPNIYDFFWFLILEIAPTVIFIVVGRQKSTPADETPRPSYDTEMENSYLRDSNVRDNSYRPPFAK